MPKIPINNFQYTIVKSEGKKRLRLNAPDYYQHWINEKTQVGDKGTITVKNKKPTRSATQLNYYAILIDLIADYSGNSWEDTHSALMIENWGVRKVKIGDKITEVRKSVSDSAECKKMDMSEQIKFTVKRCKELGIVIPKGKCPNCDSIECLCHLSVGNYHK